MGQTVYLKRKEIFAASHRLHSNELTDEQNKTLFGKCNHINGHGHNYGLEVVVKGEIDDETGIVMNLVDLKQIIHDVVMSKVDHRHLNLDVEEFKTLNPTTENVAVVIWQWLDAAIGDKLLHEVTVHETDKNSVMINRSSFS